jgi:hypothetical protein
MRALRRQCRRLLSRIRPGQVEWSGPDGQTIGELIGLVLIDLDRLSSRDRIRENAPAPFAVEFMDKRLARRLAAKYSLDVVAVEIDRRFAAAIALGPALRDASFGQVLTRLESRLVELATVLAAGRLAT